MADKPRNAAEEPSIEEILGSIRRIIAEDDDPAAATPAPVAAAPAEEEEPLELTNKIDPDGTIVNKPAEAVIAFEEEKPAPAPVAAPPVVAAPPKPIQETPKMSDTTDTILSNTAAEATTAVMSKLARHTAIAEEGHEGLTIENMVREMLKPMLKDWLDTNLPAIVEKAVDRELERLSRRV